MPSGPYASIEAVKQAFLAEPLTFADATHQLLALAASGDLDFQVQAALGIAYLVENNPRSQGGSYEAGVTLVGILNGTFPAGATPPAYAYGVLAGILAAPIPSVWWDVETKLGNLVGQDAAQANLAIQALAAAFDAADRDYREEPAREIANLMSSVPLGIADVAAVLEGQVQGDSLSAVDAIDILGRVGILYGGPLGNAAFAAAAGAVAAEVIDLVAEDEIDATAAIAALVASAQTLASLASQGGGPGALQYLIAIAGAEPDLFDVAGAQLAPLVSLDSSTPGTQVRAQDAVTAVNAARLAGQITASEAVSLLAGIASAPGIPWHFSTDPLHIVGNSVRGFVANGTLTAAHAVAAIEAAITGFGLTPDAGVTVLLGIGANGEYLLRNNMFQYVGNDALMAAAAGALTTLLDASPGLSAASIAEDLARAFLSDSSALVLKIFAQAALAAGDAPVHATLGAALGLAAEAGSRDIENMPLTAATALAAIGDRVVANASGGSDEAVTLLIGFAGATTDAKSEILAGRELVRVLGVNTPAVDSVAEVLAAVASHALSGGQATLLLAGLATASNTTGQVAAWNGLASLLSDDLADLAVLAAAIGGPGAPLGYDEAFTLLINLQTVATAEVAAALVDEIFAIALQSPAQVDRAVAIILAAVETAGQNLSGAEKEAAQASVAAVAADQIAALVAQTPLTPEGAVAAVASAIGNGTLSPLRAVAALANLQAAGLDGALIADALQALIDDAVISARQMVLGLLALQVPGASAALLAALASEIETLLTTPANFAETAGLGTTAQVLQVTSLVAALFDTDPTAAQAVLDALPDQFAGGNDIHAERASQFLLFLYGEGGSAATGTLPSMVELASTAPFYLSIFTRQLGATIDLGELSPAAAVTLLEALLPVQPVVILGQFADLIVDGRLSVAQLHAEIAQGRITASDAFEILSDIIPRASEAVRAAAIEELTALIADDAGFSEAGLAIFVTLAGSADPARREAGYAGIDALAQMPGLGAAAFEALLPLLNASNTLVVADAKAGLLSLFAEGRLTASEATAILGAQLMAGSPVISQQQALDTLVALSHVDAPFIHAYLKNIANIGLGGVTDTDVIIALADGLSGRLSDSIPAAGAIIEVASLNALSPAALADAVAQALLLSGAEKAALLAEIGGLTGMTLAYGDEIAARMYSLAALGDVMGNGLGQLSRQGAVEIVLGTYADGSRSSAIAALDSLIQAGKLSAADVADALIHLAVSAQWPVEDAIETLVGIAHGSGSPDILAATALGIADAITGGTMSSVGTLTAADILEGLNAALAQQVLTPMQAFALVEKALLLRLAQVEAFGLTGPAFVQATETLATAVNDELAYLSSHGLTVDGIVTALALASAGATQPQLIAIGAQIVAIASATLTPAAIAADIASAMDGSTGITEVQAATILVFTAIAGGEALQLEAGRAIGALYMGGSLSAAELAMAIDQPAYTGIVSPQQDLALTLGVISAGGAAAVGAIISHLRVLLTLPVLASEIADAVAADTITAVQAMDAAAAVAVSSGEVATTVAIAEALFANGEMTPAEAVAALGPWVGPGFFPADVALQVALALSAGETLANITAIGLQLGEWLAAGTLTESQLSDGLLRGFIGDPPGTAPVITLAEALNILLGVASDTSPAAIAAGVPEIGSRLFAVLSETGDVMQTIALIDASLAAGTLSGSAAAEQLITLADGRGDLASIAIATALVSLVSEGHLGSNPGNGFFLLQSALLTAVEAETLDSARAVFLGALALQGPPESGSPGSLVFQLVNGGAISASDATAQLVAATLAAPQTLPVSTVATLLAQFANTPPVSGELPPLVAASVASLETLMESGALAPSFFASPSDAKLLAEILDLVDARLASAPSAGLEALRDSLYTTLLSLPDASIVAGVEAAMTGGLMTLAHGLSMLIELVARGDASLDAAIIATLVSLLDREIATTLQVADAFASAENGIVRLAGMIDPAAPAAELTAALARLLSDTLTSGATAAATAGDIADAVGNGPALTAAQAVLALAMFGQVGSADVTHAGAVAMAGLVSANEITQSDALTGAAQVLLAAATTEAQLGGGALIAAFLGARGHDADGIVAAMVATAGTGVSREDAVRILALLTATQDPDLRDPAAPVVSDAAIAQGLLDLAPGLPSLTLAQALAALTAVPLASVTDTLDILIAVAALGTVEAQIAAGHATATVSGTFLPQALGDVIDDLATARQIHFVLGLSSGAPALAAEVAVRLDFQAPAHALAATLITALQQGAVTQSAALAFLVDFANATLPGSTTSPAGSGDYADLAFLIARVAVNESGLQGAGVEAIAGMVARGLIAPTQIFTGIDAGIAQGTLSVPQAAILLLNALPVLPSTDIAIATKLSALLAGADLFAAINDAVTSEHVGPAEGMRLYAIVAALNGATTEDAAAAMVALLAPSEPPGTTVMQAIDAIKDLGDAAVPDAATAIAALVRALVATGEVDAGQAVAQVLASGASLPEGETTQILIKLGVSADPSLSAAAAAAYTNDGSALANAVAAGVIDGVQAAQFAATVLVNHDPQLPALSLTLSLGAQLASLVGPGLAIGTALAAIASAGTPDVALRLFAAIVIADPDHDGAALAAARNLLSPGTLTLDQAIATLGQFLIEANDQAVGRLIFELAAGSVSDGAAGQVISLVDQGRISLDAILPDLQAAREAGGNAAQIAAIILGIAGAPNLPTRMAFEPDTTFSYRDLGRFLASPLAALTDPAAAAVAIAEFAAVADAALAGGQIDEAQFAFLLASFAALDGVGPYAVLAAADQLSALLGNASLSTTDFVSAMTRFAHETEDPIGKLIHLLVNMSELGLGSAVAAISALVNAEHITAAAAVGAVHEMSGTTPSGIAPGLALAPEAAAQFLLRLTLQGSGPVQGAALAQLVADMAGGAPEVGDGITGAIQAGWLTSLGALEVTAQLLAAATSDPAGTFGTWAMSHLAAFHSDAHLTGPEGAAIFLSALATSGPTGHGQILDILLALPDGIDAIHHALIADPALAAPAIDVLLSIAGDPRFGVATSAAALAEALEILHDGALTPAEMAAFAAAGGHYETLRAAILSGTPDEATKAIFTADYVAQFRLPGDPLLADTWLSGSDAQVALDYFKVTHGLMTIAEAAEDLIAFATASGVSIDEALLNLSRMFGPGDTASADAVRGYLIDRIESGDLVHDLAAHMQAAGNALSMSAALSRFFPSALSDYAHDRDTYTDQFVAEAYLLAQINAGLPLNVSAFKPFATLTVAPGEQYQVPGPLDRVSLGLERALGHLIEAPDTSAAVKAEAQAALGQRVFYGQTAIGVVDYLTDRSNPNFWTVDLPAALALLEEQADLARTASSDSDPELERQITLARLFISDSAGVGRTNPVNGALVASNLRAQLLSSTYADDMVAGFGALLSLPSSSFGRQQLLVSVQDYITHGYLSAHASDLLSDIAHLSNPQSSGHQTTQDKLYQLLSTGYSKTQGMQNVLGVIHDDIATDPRSVQGYIRLAAALDSGSVSGSLAENLLGISGLTLTAASIGSKLALWGLSQNAVSGALGEGMTDTLRGAFQIAGASAGLISATMFDSGQAAVDNASAALPNLLDFGNAVKNGDMAGILSASGELVRDYYKITTGFDLYIAADLVESLGFFLGDLATGDVDALHYDITRLGNHFVELFRSNVYVGIIAENLIEYSDTINSALHQLGSGLEMVLDDVVSGVAYLADTGDDILDFVRNIFGIDGYIQGATVFADRNLNGVQDAGEVSATANASGGYTLVNPVGRITLTGGIDTATGLAFTGILTAPAGSTVLTPLTTLISEIATPGDSNPIAAETTLSTALGLASDIDLMRFDPVAETLAGDADARTVLAANSMVLNTMTLLQAAGAADPAGLMAGRIAAGAGLDLTNADTLRNLAAEAGIGAAASAAVVALAAASNALAAQAVSAQMDAATFLRTVFAINIDTQGTAAAAIRAAGEDAGALDAAMAAHTGAALDQLVTDNLSRVGSLYPTGHVDAGISLQATLDGDGIELLFDPSYSVPGHWVRFEALDSLLPAGATLLVYAVDAAGNLVNRASHAAGADVILDMATLATIGVVSDDHGNHILLGRQSVYLSAGEQLRFAVLNGSGVVDRSPDVEILAHTDGSLQLDVAGLRVHAITNNLLSDSAELAEFQRDSGQPLLFLQQGDTLNVELVGSSANTNTLGFVQIDVDAATGAWSVGGEAYADTDAFHRAVIAELDGGFAAAHGGSFSDTTTWTVSGTTGYYAPVLMTPSGHTFVVGTANAGGLDYIRMFGENTFGFEDLAYDQGSDFDYNDMVMRLTPVSGQLTAV
ncbi:DUF4114 domain-containing protein [Aquabacter cavernae]|uniref:DUF4114 domain-containing protein n=1 Tax=Aquabacter cavernae TaxID=2496029 RepID=UPI000F8E0888|nr:DUF4114 domain-containing protein [Aquabacter cavernae]